MKFIKEYLSRSQLLEKIRGIPLLKDLLYSNPQLWHFNRQSVSRGFGVGIFAGVLPLPIQMLLAAFLAIIVRGNIPVAVLATFFSNPLTMIPIIYLIYTTGSFISGDASFININRFSAMDFNWSNLKILFASLGKNFFIGLPVVAIGLGILGYFLAYISWYVFISAKLILRRIKAVKMKANVNKRNSI